MPNEQELPSASGRTCPEEEAPQTKKAKNAAAKATKLSKPKAIDDTNCCEDPDYRTVAVRAARDGTVFVKKTCRECGNTIDTEL